MVHGLGGPLLVLSERCVWGLGGFNELVHGIRATLKKSLFPVRIFLQTGNLFFPLFFFFFFFSS